MLDTGSSTGSAARGDSARLRGVLAPVLTPFRTDGSPCRSRFLRHCRWLLNRGLGLAVFGTNSEASSLSLHEKLGLLDLLGAEGMPMGRLMPGTGTCALPEAVALTRHAVQAGCAGVLMLPPYYYKGIGDEGLYRSFATVIDRVADARLRLYLYHIPAVSGVPITHTLIDRLLQAYPGIVAGIKDSTGDWTHTQVLLERFQPRGFDVFAGTETLLLPTLRAGGAGCITATGNVNPDAIMRLYRTWRDPDGSAQQAALNRTRASFQALPPIAAMKAAIAWQSGDAGWARLRPPLVELIAAEDARLRDELGQQGFRIPEAAALAGTQADDAADWRLEPETTPAAGVTPDSDRRTPP